jgi:hypothetical protein
VAASNIWYTKTRSTQHIKFRIGNGGVASAFGVADHEPDCVWVTPQQGKRIDDLD